MSLRTSKQWWGVTLDAPEAASLARFYADLLGWRVFDDSAAWATVAPSRDAGYQLGFLTEEHYQRPVWPAVPGTQQQSMHLDLEVDDLDEAVAHAVSLGAELASYQPQETVRVLLDPAGHPFCVFLDTGSGLLPG